ncbi:MAG: fimbrillin family protein, partial [Prevotellaceae bacterium]|nr:fimbrillin family protein [Prevotellaceae bacterium]
MSSRATATAWETGDVIGITCGTGQLNIPYEYSGDATFTAVSSTNEIWIMGTNPMEISAYYPFTGDAGTTPDAIELYTSSDNEATEETRATLDVLYSEPQEVTSANNNVTLPFSHAMSRIKLTFQAAEGYSLSDIQLYLIGLKLQGSFNTATGEITVDDDSVDD